MNRWIIFFSVLIGLMYGSSPVFGNGYQTQSVDVDSYNAHFYLSTEKSFTPRENARMKIESRGLPNVTVRLYRVPDPQNFITSQKNIKRVYIESEYIKRNPTELLVKYVNELKHAFRLHAHQRVVNADTRSAALERTEGFLQRNPVKKSLFMGKLQEYEFIREFPWKLAAENSWTYTYIEFGQLPAGLYLAEVYSPTVIGYTFVHVSETTLLIKQSASRLLVRSVDKTTGSGVNAEIAVYDFTNGNLLESGTAAQDGVFQFAFQKNQYTELMVCSASRNEQAGKEDFSFYKISLYPAAEKERMVYLYSHSPIYRPGDTVEIKGIIRDYHNSTYTIPDVKSAALQVIDPRGNATGIGEVEIGAYGTFIGTYQTQDICPTGMYSVIAHIDGKDYAGEFRVEHYIPPVFQVKVSSPQKLVVGEETIPFTIKASYFTGNPVTKGALRYSIFRTPFREDVIESEKDIFADPEYAAKIEFVASEEEAVEYMLDAKGEMEGSFSPADHGLDRDYVYVIKAEIIDPSYAIGVGSTKVMVMQHEFVMSASVGKSVYLAGEEVTIETRLTYPDGKPVTGKELVYQATLEENAAVIAQGAARTDEHGRLKLAFQATGKGFLRIQLSARDRFQHEISENVFTWIGQEGGTFVYTSGDITIVLDKAQYQVGEIAKALILSPVSEADVLIALEREEVFEYSRKHVSGNAMLLDIPITSHYVPNVFVNLLFVFDNQVYEHTANIKVPPASKVLNLTITPDKQVYLPRERGTIRVRVTDEAGKPVQAEVSLAVVNEALFQLSPEIAPNPWLFFYSPRWDAISTLNSIALRFYGYSRSLRERFALDYYAKKLWDFEDFFHAGVRYAGFKDIKDLESAPRTAAEEERKLFKDQIAWQGQLVTDEQGFVEIPLTFPDNLTTWRITAMAVTQDTRLGKANAHVKTEKNFFVRVNTPQFVSYVDQTEGYVTIVNNRNASKSITLNLTFDGIQGDFSQKTVTLAPHGEETFAFALRPDHVGRAEIRAEAVSDAEKDVLVQSIEMLPVAVKKMSSGVKIVQDASPAFQISIPDGAIRETIRLHIGLAEMENPFGVVTEALPYLKQYPYGCVEQTTSSFLPNLIAFESAKKLGLELPETFADREKIVRMGLEKLYAYRNEDGGWGWWNEGHSDLFMTAYVLYALTFVDELYPDLLNVSIAKQAVRALSNLLDSGEGDERARIYAYYVLSRLGITYEYMLEKLVENASDSPYFLALLILYAQQSDLDEEMIQSLAQKLDGMARSAGTGVSWSSAAEHYWYGSEVVATSVAVRALLAAEFPSENIEKGALYLMLQRQGNAWRSTRETAEAVYALSEYAASRAQREQTHLPVAVFDGSQQLGVMQFNDLHYKNTLQLPPELLAPGKTFTIHFGVQAGVYVGNFTLEYHTGETTIEAENQGLALSRQYYKVENKTDWHPLPKPLTVNPGDVVLVGLEVDAAQDIDYVVLEDGIPAGCVPVLQVNEYDLGDEFSFFRDVAHHEFGKNTAGFFLETLNQQSKATYYYLIQAVYPGEYHVLPTLGCGMYQPELRGNSASDVFRIEQ